MLFMFFDLFLQPEVQKKNGDPEGFFDIFFLFSLHAFYNFFFTNFVPKNFHLNLIIQTILQQ